MPITHNLMYQKLNQIKEEEDTREITASEALKQSSRKRASDESDDMLYSVVIKRVFGMIRQESEKHNTHLAFVAPCWVLDCPLGDAVRLAKQIKARLVQLGYRVDRDGDVLEIDWSGRTDEELVSIPTPKPGTRRSARLAHTDGPYKGFAKEHGVQTSSKKKKNKKKEGEGDEEKKEMVMTFRRVPKSKK